MNNLKYIKIQFWPNMVPFLPFLYLCPPLIYISFFPLLVSPTATPSPSPPSSTSTPPSTPTTSLHAIPIQCRSGAHRSFQEVEQFVCGRHGYFYEGEPIRERFYLRLQIIIRFLILSFYYYYFAILLFFYFIIVYYFL